jgi:hypothetical protein
VIEEAVAWASGEDVHLGAILGQLEVDVAAMEVHVMVEVMLFWLRGRRMSRIQTTLHASGPQVM